VDKHKCPICGGYKIKTVSKICRKCADKSPEGRRKKSISHLGKKNYFWKHGKTEELKLIRRGIEYRLWREAVFARDNWTCKYCGSRGCDLQSHHIKSFTHYPELRFAIDNGETVCLDCHKKTDNYSGHSSYKGMLALENKLK
jgi:5-methylcytosine-specific restriction endonuclease McrA